MDSLRLVPSCPIPEPPLSTMISALIYNGSSFGGFQQNKNNKYAVDVEIQQVDTLNSLIYGCLTIKGLTEDPSITTFFQGEIISPKYPFLTRKWDADEEIDRKHWSKFPQFLQFADNFNSDDFDYDNLSRLDCLFMRWKELFLASDHSVSQVSGASFAGFYYVCVQLREESIMGYYYHKDTDMFQSLSLSHVPVKTTSSYFTR